MDRQPRSILIAEYAQKIQATDKLPTDDARPVLFGLYGEVGSIMAIAKKIRREEDVYADYRHAFLEEFGDAFWYFAALCRRLRVDADSVFSGFLGNNKYSTALAATDMAERAIALTHGAPITPEFYDALLRLGEATSALLALSAGASDAMTHLQTFVGAYLNGLQAAKISFGHVLGYNIDKTCGRFVEPERDGLPTFDLDFDEEERLPEHFEIKISVRKSGKSYMSWNGVFIGDPLTDNIVDEDGYRFHDVFHFAHASVLHWSPTFRALIKHKRKSNPKVDETQDGGRAIVVEEGLTAWIFSCAKRVDFFKNKKGVSFDMLKTIQEFVSGYEVESCPLKLWEEAIMQGYEVFLKLRANGGGIVVGDRKSRSVMYKHLTGS